MKEKENDRQRYNGATQQEEKRKKALINVPWRVLLRSDQLRREENSRKKEMTPTRTLQTFSKFRICQINCDGVFLFSFRKDYYSVILAHFAICFHSLFSISFFLHFFRSQFIIFLFIVVVVVFVVYSKSFVIKHFSCT